MKLVSAALVAFLTISPVLAQAPQAVSQTPSQVALQITSIIGQWAQAIEALQKQNTDLQQQLAAVTKERDELKAKLPPGEHK